MPEPGLFEPDDVVWRVNREAVLLASGPRALLLQLAHPLVAAGVADHSTFLREPLKRLVRTLEAVLAIVFGDGGEARAAAAGVAAVHRRVRGVLREGTKAFPAGTPYDAADPHLARWVHATLVDSARVGFECFVRPLADHEHDRFVRETDRMARLFGVPEGLAFAGRQDFECYLKSMIEGPELEITPTAARLADAVLHPPLWWAPRFAGDVASLASVALLPPAIRDRYGLPWGPGRERAFRALRGSVRGALPFLPDRVRLFPRAYRAERSPGA